MRLPCGRHVAVAASLLLALGAAPAGAHVQISPTRAAPGDSVRFVLLVPGERAPARTTRVEVLVPPGVLPYSFEDVPGWARTVVPGPDGAPQRLRWEGRLAPDGFVELAFLASTPDAAGPIAWKAVQQYDDGTVSRWVGPEGSDEPAAVTRIDPAAPRSNAGGEGAVPAGAPDAIAGATSTSAAAPAAASTTAVAGASTTAPTSAEGPSLQALPAAVAPGAADGTARGMALAALGIGLLAGVLSAVAVMRRRPPPGPTSPDA